MNIKIVSICLTLCLAFATNATASNELPKESRVQGGIALIPVGNSVKPAVVRFNGNQVMVLPDYAADNRWLAIVGIPVTHKGTQVKLKINGEFKTFGIKRKSYPKQYLTVKKKHANPNNKQLKRIRQEQQHIRAAFKQFSPKMNWEPFIWPVKGALSSLFGFQRFFNKQPRRPHSGLDIAAAKGTAVKSPASGEVVLIGDFYFNGNSVFIDHGQGLISMMCHLNKINVKQGQLLKQGDIIGQVGATGRVTGPHLHWSVSLNNARIDPLLLVDKANNP